MAPKRRRTAEPSSSASSLVLRCGSEEQDGLRTSLASMWRDGTLCDVEILVDGRSFHAHRCLLAAESPYLKALVTTTAMKERSGAIELKEISAATLASALEFMYLREVTLASQDELQPLLQAASLLRCAALESVVELAMAERLDATSSLRALGLADHLNLPRLAEAATKIGLAEFVAAAAAEDGAALIALPAVRLGELLGSDDLMVQNETVVFEVVKTWLSAQQPAASAEVAASLLAHVRFPLLPDAAKAAVEEDPLVAQHAMIVAKAYREALTGAETPRTRPRQGGPLRYEDLAAGMKVRILDDLEYVKEQCMKAVPGADSRVGWAEDSMGAMLGKTHVVAGLCSEGCSAAIETWQAYWNFPYTVLRRA